MYLKSLTIKDKDGFIIRHIDFKLGANIIKGEISDTNTNTNSIGKTTLLRSLDFCLGGKWESLITDRELKTKNNTVLNFFGSVSPNFELLITKDFRHKITSTIKINRFLILTINSKRNENKLIVKNFINDNELDEDSFKLKLKEFLFNSESDKPTFRQLIPKFIRTSDYQISNIVRYLHPTTPSWQYELLHLFLFDFMDMNLIHNRIAKEHELIHKNNQIKSLNSIISTGTQELNDLRQSELIELQEKYNTFQITKEYEHENDVLNRTKEALESIKASISNYYLDKEVWEKRLLEIITNSSHINTETINYMYQEAGIYNVDIQKKYEETVAFHQAMLKNEIEFIKNSINNSAEAIANLKIEFTKKSEEYSTLLQKLSESGSLAEYTALGNQINILTKEIAENDAILNTYNSSLEQYQSLKTEFNKLTEKLQEKLVDFRRKLAIFNRYFSEFSKDLTKNGYLLIVEQDKNQHFNLLPRPVNGDSHVGDGRKQSVVIAFDLAYVAFVSDQSINLVRPHFFSQDKIEIVDANMLAELINLVNGVGCQFLFPIIKDKLDKLPNFNEDDVILSLTEKDKFFDIENYADRKNHSLIKSA